MRSLLIIPFIFLLTACGGGGGGGSDIPASRSATVASGVAFDGLILNGKVAVYAFDAGSKGELLGQGETNSRGEYSVSFTTSDRPVMIEVSGGKYVEEASKKIVPLKEGQVLRAVLNHRSGSPINISMTYYTNMAAGLSTYLVSTGMTVSEAISVSNQRMSDLIGLDITKVTPLDITDQDNITAAITDAHRYGFATAAISSWSVWASEQNSIQNDSYTSIAFAQLAYDDVLNDGQMDGHGTDGPISVGVVPVTPNTYRTDLPRNILVMAGSAYNVTGFGPADLVELALFISSSEDPAFVGQPIAIDFDAPIISNISHEESELVSGTITFSADVSDIVGLSSVTFMLDDVEHEVVYSSAASTVINTVSLSEGNHIVSVVAANVLGAESRTNTTLLISNSGITIANIDPENDAYVRGNDVTVSADVDDPIGLTEVLFQIDTDTPLAAVIVDGVIKKSVVIDSTQLVDGAHSLFVHATNTVLNSDTKSVRYNIDNTAPIPSLNFDDYVVVNGLYDVVGTTRDVLALNSTSLFVAGEKVGEWGTDTSLSHPLESTRFPDGNHLVVLESRDRAGNIASDSRFISIDNTAPSVAIVSPVSGDVAGQTLVVNGSVTDSTSDIGIIELYVDGVLYNTISGTNSPSFSIDTSVLVGGAHTLRLTASDVLGNSASTTVSDILVDQTPPTLVLDPDLDGRVTSGMITIRGSVTDDHGISRATLSFGGAQVETWSENALIAYELDSSTFNDGTHVILLEAVDRAGNTVSVSRSITIDSSAPLVVILTPLSGDIVGDSFVVTGSVTDSTATVANIELYVDGVLVNTLNGTNNPSFTVDSSGMSDGVHSITLKAFDTLGNNAFTTLSNLIVDHTPPVLTLDPALENGVLSGTIAVNGSAIDLQGLQNATLYVGAAQVQTWTENGFLNYSLDTGTFNDGTHTLLLTAVDSAGNSVSTSRTITIDNTAPTTAIVTPVSGLIVGDSLIVNASVTDTVSAIGTINLYVDGVLKGTLSGTGSPSFTVDSSNISEGAHVVTLTASDVIGNSASTTVENVIVDHTSPILTLDPVLEIGVFSGTVLINGSAIDQQELKNATLFVGASQVQTWTVNGPINYSLDTGTFNDGTHTLTLTGEDSAGNTASIIRTISVDNTAPTTAIVTPVSGSIVGDSLIVNASVTDTVSAIGTINLYVDGVLKSTLSGTGSPSFTVDSSSMSEGAHVVTLTASDVLGNSASTTVASVIVDHSVPVLTLDPALDGKKVKGALLIEGIIDDTNNISSGTLTFGGAQVRVWQQNSVFQYNLNTTTFNDGVHTLTLAATDNAGNSTQLSRTITVDNTGPSVAIVSPVPGDVAGDSLIVNGSVTDAMSPLNTIELLINGSSYESIAGTNSPSFTVDSSYLDEGLHTFTLKAKDSLGNTSSTTVSNVFIDHTVPTLVLDPELEGMFATGIVNITGSIADARGISSGTLSIDASPQQSWFSSAAIFNAFDTRSLTDGSHTIGLNATDRANNSSSLSRTFVVDNTDPVVSIAFPEEGDIINSSFTLMGSATDATSGIGLTTYIDPYFFEERTTPVQLLVDGVHYAGISAGASISRSINIADLTEGQHSITVITTDNSGNVTEKSVSFIVDTIAPTFSFSVSGYSPAYASVTSSDITLQSITISGTVYTPPPGVTTFTATKQVLTGATKESKQHLVTIRDRAGHITTRTLRCRAYGICNL